MTTRAEHRKTCNHDVARHNGQQLQRHKMKDKARPAVCDNRGEWRAQLLRTSNELSPDESENHIHVILARLRDGEPHRSVRKPHHLSQRITTSSIPTHYLVLLSLSSSLSVLTILCVGIISNRSFNNGIFAVGTSKLKAVSSAGRSCR